MVQSKSVIRFQQQRITSGCCGTGQQIPCSPMRTRDDKVVAGCQLLVKTRTAGPRSTRSARSGFRRPAYDTSRTPQLRLSARPTAKLAVGVIRASASLRMTNRRGVAIHRAKEPVCRNPGRRYAAPTFFPPYPGFTPRAHSKAAASRLVRL
jgi:hypothetical protein